MIVLEAQRANPAPALPHKQKRPAGLRGVWSGKRDSNYFL